MEGQVVAVVGAAGGVGASTLACLLARRRASAGHRVVLVDLDPAGGGLDVLLGVEQVPGARWSDLRHTGSGVDGAELVGALPHWRGVAVVSGDAHRTQRTEDVAGPDATVAAAVVGAVVEAGGLVVLDTSARGAGVLPAWAVVARADAALLVTAQDVVGVAAGLAARPWLPDGRCALVLRARRAPVVAPVEAARALRLRHAATLPTDRSVAASTDRGLGPVPGRTLARAVARVDDGALDSRRGRRGRADGPAGNPWGEGAAPAPHGPVPGRGTGRAAASRSPRLGSPCHHPVPRPGTGP
nr:pilus assembly protein FlpE [uncultured Actinotalea sp.]